MNLINPRNIKTRSLHFEKGDDAFKVEPCNNGLDVKFMKQARVTRYYTWPEMYSVIYDACSRTYMREDTRERVEVDPDVFKLHSYDSLTAAQQRLMASAAPAQRDDSDVSHATAQHPHIISVHTTEFFPADIVRFQAPRAHIDGDGDGDGVNEVDAMASAIVNGAVRATRVDAGTIQATCAVADQLVATAVATDAVNAIGADLSIGEGAVVVAAGALHTVASPAPGRPIVPTQEPPGVRITRDTRVGASASVVAPRPERRLFPSARESTPGALLLRLDARDTAVTAVPASAADMLRAFAGLPAPYAHTPQPFDDVSDAGDAGGRPVLRVMEAMLDVAQADTYAFSAEGVVSSAGATASVEVHVDGVLVAASYRRQACAQAPVRLDAGRHAIVVRTVHDGELVRVLVEHIAQTSGARTALRNDSVSAQQPDVAFFVPPRPPRGDGVPTGDRAVVASVCRILETPPGCPKLHTAVCTHGAAGNFTVATVSAPGRPGLLQVSPDDVREQAFAPACMARYGGTGCLQWLLQQKDVDLPADTAAIVYTGLHTTHDDGVVASVCAYSRKPTQTVALVADAGGYSHRMRWAPRASAGHDSGVVRYSSLGAAQWWASFKGGDGLVVDACETHGGASIVVACAVSAPGEHSGRRREPWVVIDGAGAQRTLENRSGDGLASLVGFVKLDSASGHITQHCSIVLRQGLSTLCSVGAAAYPGGGFVGHFACGVRGDGLQMEFFSGDEEAPHRTMPPGPDTADTGAAARSSTQVVARYDASMRLVWVATVTCDAGDDSLVADTRSECIVDKATGLVTCLFKSFASRPVIITDGAGRTTVVNAGDDASDAVGLAQLDSNGSLVWASHVGQRSRNCKGKRALAAGPGPGGALVLAACVGEHRLLVVDGASGAVAGASPLRGLRPEDITLSQGGPQHAFVVLRNATDANATLEAPDLLGPGGANLPGARVAMPPGLATIGIDFLPHSKQKLVVDGDLVVTGHAAVGRGGCVLPWGAVGEGHLAPRVRKAMQGAARMTQGFGSVGALADTTTHAGAAVAWDAHLAKGVVSSHAMNDELAEEMNVVLADEGRRLIATVSGAYAVCIKAWSTSRSSADDAFAWRLVRSGPTGEAFATSSLVGASSAIIALDAGDSFAVVNSTDADVTVLPASRLTVQLLGSP